MARFLRCYCWATLLGCLSVLQLGCSRETPPKSTTPALGSQERGATSVAPIKKPSYEPVPPTDLVRLGIGRSERDWIATSKIDPKIDSIPAHGRIESGQSGSLFRLNHRGSGAFYRLQQPIEGDLVIQIKVRHAQDAVREQAKLGVGLVSAEIPKHLTDIFATNVLELSTLEDMVIEFTMRSDRVSVSHNGIEVASANIEIDKKKSFFVFYLEGGATLDINSFEAFVSKAVFESRDAIKSEVADKTTHPSFFGPRPSIEGETRLVIGGTIGRVGLGEKGRTLVVFDKAKLAILLIDVETMTTKSSIGVSSPDTIFAAGTEDLIIHSPPSKSLKRIKFGDLNNTKESQEMSSSQIFDLALGGAANGPLVVAYSAPSGPNPRQYEFLNPDTLLPLTIRGDLKQLSWTGAPRVRASSDGQTFGISGDSCMSLTFFGDQLVVGSERQPTGGRRGDVHPTASGGFMFVRNGLKNAYLCGSTDMYTPEYLALRFDSPGESSERLPLYNASNAFGQVGPAAFIPSFEDRFVVKVDAHEPTSKPGFYDSRVSIFGLGATTPLAEFSDIDICHHVPNNETAVPVATKIALSFSDRVFYLPSRSLLITIPEKNDAVVFRRFVDVLDKLRNQTEPYVLLNDQRVPPAVSGTQYVLKSQVSGNVPIVNELLPDQGGRSKAIGATTFDSDGSLRFNVPFGFVESGERFAEMRLKSRTENSPGVGVEYKVGIPVLRSEDGLSPETKQPIPNQIAVSPSAESTLAVPSSQPNTPSAIELSKEAINEALTRLKTKKSPAKVAKSRSPVQLLRTWASADGKFKTEATYGGLSEDKSAVKLIIKADSRTVEVPIEKLSDADRTWLNQRSKDEQNDLSSKETETAPISDSTKRETLERLAVDYVNAIAVRSKEKFADCFVTWEDMRPFQADMTISIIEKKEAGGSSGDKSPEAYYASLSNDAFMKATAISALAKIARFKLMPENIVAVRGEEEKFGALRRFEQLDILLEDGKQRALLTLYHGTYTSRGWLVSGENSTFRKFDDFVQYAPFKFDSETAANSTNVFRQFEAKAKQGNRHGIIRLSSPGNTDPEVGHRSVRVMGRRLDEINYRRNAPGYQFRIKVWTDADRNANFTDVALQIAAYSISSSGTKIPYPEAAQTFNNVPKISPTHVAELFELPADGIAPKRKMIRFIDRHDSRLAMFELIYDASVPPKVFRQMESLLIDCLINCDL